jgi:hypothetical protein
VRTPDARFEAFLEMNLISGQRLASAMACSGHAATHNPQDLHASAFGVYATFNP